MISREELKKKNKLRNDLFLRLSSDDGILVTELLSKLSFITNSYDELKDLFNKSIDGFDDYSSISDIKKVDYNNSSYLGVKFRIWEYLLADLDKETIMSKNDVRECLNEKFFINNFNERKLGNIDYLNLYYFNEYKGNVSSLIDFYNERRDIFNLPNSIRYESSDEDNNKCYFSIDLRSGRSQVGFENEDQSLYEQLYFQRGMRPSAMQDARDKMGIDTMVEYFNKCKKIMVPKEFIPEELKSYLSDKSYVKKRTK